MKEVIRKQKLDIEIKENQVKVLKQRLESNQEELQGLSLAKEGMRSHESQLDGKLKTIKAKAKRFDSVLKCLFNTVRRVAAELALA